MYQNFNDYLVSKFNRTVEDCTVDGIIETVLPMGGGEENRIVVFYPKDMLSLSVFYGNFQDKHFKALCAYVDNYNERKDSEYELRCFDGQIWAEIDDFGLDEQQAIQMIEDVLKFFAEDGQLATELRELISNASMRQKLIHERVLTLKARAGMCERQGDHAMAMELLKEVCELYYGYNHMEMIGLHYCSGLDKPQLNLYFPKNEEYGLECMLLAMEKDKDNIIVPMLAYNLAKKLGKNELCEKIEAIGHKRGSWEYAAFKQEGAEGERLSRVARCYREGIACRKSKRKASYYERLAAGEEQEVFKDMLTDGFDRVFLLMDQHFYYRIHSLSELDGLSDEFKSRYLYGDKVGECCLPSWFVPLVNGLNEQDRDIVLGKAKDKMARELNDLFKRVESGELEVVEEAGETSGVLFEEDGDLCYIYPDDIKDLVDCEAKDALQRVLKKFEVFRCGQ